MTKAKPKGKPQGKPRGRDRAQRGSKQATKVRIQREMKGTLIMAALEGRISRIETLMKIYDSQRREALNLLGPEEE